MFLILSQWSPFTSYLYREARSVPCLKRASPTYRFMYSQHLLFSGSISFTFLPASCKYNPSSIKAGACLLLTRA